jgi:hypothetical protein
MQSTVFQLQDVHNDLKAHNDFYIFVLISNYTITLAVIKTDILVSSFVPMFILFYTYKNQFYFLVLPSDFLV